MAPEDPVTFKYRFVPSGTRFKHVAGIRLSAPGVKEDKARLYENEVAVAVGRENWSGDLNERAVIDHRVLGEDGRLPSAAVAVMHHAAPLQQFRRERKPKLVWLVTVDRPNFDCYMAVYLARWFIEHDTAADGFRRARFTCDGFADDDGATVRNHPAKRFDWFKPDLTRFSAEVHWAVLLASFSAHTDRAGRVPCPRNRALHSILYAAVERGRPYATEDNGAHEFFEAARLAMAGSAADGAPLNPLYDSVLGGSALFAPELALLNVATEAYERDIARARKAIVFLPKRDDTFTHLYRAVAAKPLFETDKVIERSHLEFGGPGRRMQVDGLYVSDPECLLVREWARHDIDHSSLRDGFTFTMIARSGRHPAPNEYDYSMSIDPKKARKCHLYPVWARLQAAEVAELQAQQQGKAPPAEPPVPREGYADRAGDLPALFADPWYDGVDYSCRVLGTPNGGTLLLPGTDRGLEDDKVAAIVQDELELVVFETPFEFLDIAARANIGNVNKVHIADSPRKESAPIEEGRYRFGTVVLSDDVELGSAVFAEQTSRVLWRMLHPDQRDGPPREIAEECCIREGDVMGVWSTSGVMIAHKAAAGDSVRDLRNLFRKVAVLARGVDRLIQKHSWMHAASRAAAGRAVHRSADEADESEKRVRQVLRESRALTRLTMEVRQAFGLPAGQIIERFAKRAGLFETIEVLHDATRSEQTQSNLDLTQRLTTASVTVANVQLKVELLELIFVGIYSTELAHIIAPFVVPHEWELVFVLVIALALSAIAAMYLRPWRHSEMESGEPPQRWEGRWLLIGFIAVIIFGIGWGGWTGVKSIWAPPAGEHGKSSADERQPTKAPAKPAKTPAKPTKTPAHH